MSINHAVRQKDMLRRIADDPYTITVTIRGLTADDADTSFSCTGRVVLAGARGLPMLRYSGPPEAPVGKDQWLILLPSGQTRVPANARITAARADPEETRYFRAAYSLLFGYGQEVVADELY